MSWLYNHRDQLDGYELYAEIAYRFRPKVLPDDRDDIEMEIVLKLKTVADKKDQVTIGFLYAVARNIVRTYWRKKYRERRRVSHLYEGDKGLMIAGSWKIVSYDPDIEARLDAEARLKTLPKRMVKAGIIRDEGGKLNNADKLYLCRQRHRQSKYNWSDAEKIEWMRQLYVDEALPCSEVAKAVGKSRSAVQRQLNKLGVIRR
ncbi:unnamed protein product [marine sediment metagenome]|uniref:Uncharacterized protein n=1 Tax=marine sediment metagenome TaxID=412755 RepID=X1QQF3_9ZZZZ